MNFKKLISISSYVPIFIGVSLLLLITNSCDKTDNVDNGSSAISLTTTTVTNIGGTSAISGGNITNANGETITTRGICWAKTQQPTINNSKIASGSGTGTYSCLMSGLTSNTTYYVRAFATSSKGTSYGNQLTFKTIVPYTNSFTATIDGVPFTSTNTSGLSTFIGIQISAFDGLSSISVILDPNITVGTHPVDDMMNSYQSATYTNLTTNESYLSQSGSIVITSHDKTNMIIKGTISFIGKPLMNSSTASITNGNFDIHYTPLK